MDAEQYTSLVHCFTINESFRIPYLCRYSGYIIRSLCPRRSTSGDLPEYCAAHRFDLCFDRKDSSRIDCLDADATRLRVGNGRCRAPHR